MEHGAHYEASSTTKERMKEWKEGRKKGRRKEERREGSKEGRNNVYPSKNFSYTLRTHRYTYTCRFLSQTLKKNMYVMVWSSSDHMVAQWYSIYLVSPRLLASVSTLLKKKNKNKNKKDFICCFVIFLLLINTSWNFFLSHSNSSF